MIIKHFYVRTVYITHYSYIIICKCGKYFVTLHLDLVFCSELLSVQDLKGNQVKNLSSPAAVTSVIGFINQKATV